MSRLFGIAEVIEKETNASAAIPSPHEVRNFWNEIIRDADKVEELLHGIRIYLRVLKKWRHQGFVTQDEVDNANEWFSTRASILKYLLIYRSQGAFLEETFCDGSGI